MPYSKTLPPSWQPDAVPSPQGWRHPVTGELLISMKNGPVNNAGTHGIIERVRFEKKRYSQGDVLKVLVEFNDFVDVSVGASLVVHSSGMGGDITLHAVAQANVTQVVFSKEVDNATDVLVPAESAILSVLTQTISGTIVDHDASLASNKAISANALKGCGSRVIA